MTFTKYVCWHADEVMAIAPVDAGGMEHSSVGKDAVFLATHQPLSHHRRAGSTQGQAELVNQAQVLDEFQASMAGQTDSRIMIFTGAVGTGKSHAVKWLHAMSGSQNNWHQVYIEKSNTSLKKVIEKILEGLSGPKVDELRDSLKTASSANTTIEETMDRVLNELGSNLQFSETAEAAGSEEKVARECLTPILQDPVLREHFVSTAGPIRRITQIAYEVGEAPENEHDVSFKESDLPLDIGNLDSAAAPTQTAIKLLSRSSAVREKAIEVINVELAAAKASVFLGKGVQLSEIFKEIRTELRVQGKELVIYIEDFVLLHGIDRELADVFTQHTGTTRDKCALRVAIAVTDGYLASGRFATLISRASVFSLNLVLDEDIDPAHVRSFIARYLNALRLGSVALVEARSEQPSAQDDAWIPNACAKARCSYVDECHLAFGVSDEGYGLYPYNDDAIDNLVQTISSASDVTQGFDPRLAIRGLIHEVLPRAAIELPRSAFPSDHVAAAIDQERSAVPFGVRVELKKTALGRRRLSLLAFWAPRPFHRIDNVDPGIHVAFDLPMVDDAPIETKKPSGEEEPPPPPPPPPPPDDVEFAEWANGKGTLKSATARNARQHFYDAIVNTVAEGSYGLRVARQSTSGGRRKHKVGITTIDENCIDIEDTQGGGAAIPKVFKVTNKRSDENAVLIQSTLRASASGSWQDQPLERYAEFRSFVESEARKLAKVATARISESSVNPWMELLSITAQPEVASADGKGKILDIALRPRVVVEDRSPQWSAFVATVDKVRSTASTQIIDRLATSKGIGRPSVLDAAELTKTLGRLRTVSEVSLMKDSSDPDVHESQRVLGDAISKALTAESRRLQPALDRCSKSIDDDLEWEELSEASTQFITDVRNAGLFSGGLTADELTELQDAVAESGVANFHRLKALVDSNSLTIWDLAVDQVPEIERLGSFVALLDQEVSRVTEAAKTRSSAGSAAVGPGDLAGAYRTIGQDLQVMAKGGTHEDSA